VEKNYHIAIVSPQVVGIGQTPETYSSQQINLARCWADSGHRVDVITGRCSGLAEALKHERIRLFEKPVIRLGGTFGMPLILGGWSLLASTKYDMVFSSEHYQPATFLSCLLSKDVVIYQGQNTVGSTAFKRFAIGAMEAMFGPLVKRRYRKVVAKTKAAEDLVRMRGLEKAVTIPCGYDANRFRRPSPKERILSRSQMGFNDEQLIMVFAGNLLALKNVASGIEACAMLRNEGIDAHFVIAGKGPEREKLQNLVDSLDVAAAVHFRGQLNWRELRNVYWAGDVFVFPTRHEIFGLVLMEALACGLSIVSTPCPAATDILSGCPKAGICVPIDDPKSISISCRSLFLDRHRIDAFNRTTWLCSNNWHGISERILQSIFE
jgi:glycosyltransferase involved in cell wall biosynthesis